MFTQYAYHTFQRYRTLQTDRIRALPVVILMPHSACNCRCVMCDIWKDNRNLKQLTEKDISGLLLAFKKFGTQQVVMSGGEALLNANFFTLCRILRQAKIKVTLLSTGLLLRKHAEDLMHYVNDIIVSLDGNEKMHDEIRNISGAYNKLKEGVSFLHGKQPTFRITGRSVIHKMNFRIWPAIIRSAISLGLDGISFLPADVSSQAFNRELPWDQPRQQELLLRKEELPELLDIIHTITNEFRTLVKTGYIAESPEKLAKIYGYYAAFYDLNPFPYKQCNAPWVSAVIEADGTVRPCFFHQGLGNIHDHSLDDILNSKKAIEFRKSLDIDTNPTCRQCVCYLNLKPGVTPS